MKLKPEDLRIDIFRISNWAGDYAVRITHLPTGMVSSCDTDCPVHLGAYIINDDRKKCAMRTLELLVDDEALRKLNEV